MHATHVIAVETLEGLGIALPCALDERYVEIDDRVGLFSAIVIRAVAPSAKRLSLVRTLEGVQASWV